MSMVNEQYMNDLPSGVIGMIENGYELTYLDKVDGELECDMVIGADEDRDIEWTIFYDGSKDIRIQVGMTVPVDDRFINKLIDENGVDRETARGVVKGLIYKFSKVINLLETSGGVCKWVDDDTPKFEVWEISISRDVSVDTLVLFASMIEGYVEYIELALDEVGANYL